MTALRIEGLKHRSVTNIECNKQIACTIEHLKHGRTGDGQVGEPVAIAIDSLKIGTIVKVELR